MQHTRLLSFSVLAVILSALLAAPVTAFFSELDGLKQMVASASASPDEGLQDLVAQLDKPAAGSFTDVKDEWYAQFIGAVVDWGIVSGYRSQDGALTGKYGPADNVTRIQTLKMALKAAQIDEATCTKKSTNPRAKGHWGEVYLDCAETLGMRIVKNNPDPDSPAARSEVLAIIHDAFRKDVPPLFSNFADTRGDPYEKDVAYATINEIVSGDTDENGLPKGTFRPRSPINRGEVAKIVYKAIEKYSTF